jgi:hypothetical protein
MTEAQRNAIILKATIEIDSSYEYKIKNSGLGPALVVDVGTRPKAAGARKIIPHKFEGLRTIIIYSTYKEENDEN